MGNTNSIYDFKSKINKFPNLSKITPLLCSQKLEQKIQTLKFICHENKNDYFRFFIVSRIYFH